MSFPIPSPPHLAHAPCPRPFLPALVPGAIAALFLATVWSIGFSFGSKAASGFRPDSLVQQVIGVSEAAQLDSRARLFEHEANRYEQRADSFLMHSFGRVGIDGVGGLLVKADTTAAGAMKKRADLYRQRVPKLDSAAAAREVVLAAREAKRQLWVYIASLDVLVAALASLYAVGIALRKVPHRCVLTVLAKLLPPALLAGLVFACTWYDYNTPPYLWAAKALGDDVLYVARFSDGLHIVAVTLFALGAVFAGSALPPMGGELTPAAAERAARDVVEGMRATRVGLYVGATMLVVYVAAVSTFFQWTLEFVDPTQKQLFSGFQALTNGAVTARSLLASGLLLSLYGAATFMLRLMAGFLADQARPGVPVAERDQWLSDQGIASTNWAQPLKPLAAILAPAATGVVSQILQNL